MSETAFGGVVIVVVFILGIAFLRYRSEGANRRRASDEAELRGRNDAFQEIRAAHPEWKDELDGIEHPHDPYDSN